MSARYLGCDQLVWHWYSSSSKSFVCRTYVRSVVFVSFTYTSWCWFFGPAHRHILYWWITLAIRQTVDTTTNNMLHTAGANVIGSWYSSTINTINRTPNSPMTVRCHHLRWLIRTRGSTIMNNTCSIADKPTICWHTYRTKTHPFHYNFVVTSDVSETARIYHQTLFCCCCVLQRRIAYIASNNLSFQRWRWRTGE